MKKQKQTHDHQSSQQNVAGNLQYQQIMQAQNQTEQLLQQPHQIQPHGNRDAQVHHSQKQLQKHQQINQPQDRAHQLLQQPQGAHLQCQQMQQQQQTYDQQLKTSVDDLLRDARLALSTPLVFVIQKALTETDLSEDHNCLSMPASSINKEFLESFLTDDEKVKAESGEHISVRLFGPGSIQYIALEFTRWPTNNSWIYVLVTEWNKVRKDYELEEGMIIQLWSFRVNPNIISFAFAVRRI